VLCADGPVRDLAGLSLVLEHRRGHGALYDAVNHGRVDIGRLRRSLAGLALPRAADGRLVLAADISNWLRPGAATSAERLFCHVYGCSRPTAKMTHCQKLDAVYLQPGQQARQGRVIRKPTVDHGPGGFHRGAAMIEVEQELGRNGPHYPDLVHIRSSHGNLASVQKSHSARIGPYGASPAADDPQGHGKVVK
jgi:hypothetical protein